MNAVVSVIAEKYNNLSSIFEAELVLATKEKDRIIDPLIQIIFKHGLKDLVGVRLLHKHNDIKCHEVMAESYVIDNLGFSLVTRAIAASDINADYAPNSWILSEGSFIPMEFSLKKLLRGPNISPSNNKIFFDEIASEIERLGLSNLIGPSLLGSDFIERYKPIGSSMMIEFTDHEKRANILRFITPYNTVDGEFVETHWCISGEETNVDGKKIATMACKSWCPKIQNPPVHQGTTQHDFS